MSTSTDPVRARMAAANPAPVDAELPGVLLDGDVLLDVITERSGEMTFTKTREPRTEKPRRLHRNWAWALAGAFVVVLLAIGIVGFITPDGSPDVGDDPTTTLPQDPTTTAVSTTQSATSVPTTTAAIPPTTTTPATTSTTTTVAVASPVTYYDSEDGLPEGYPQAVTVAANGDVWVGVADPVEPAGPCHLARFDGTDWTSFEPGTGCITALFPAPGGGVIAAVLTPSGELRLMEFDGAEWVDHSARHGLPPIEEPVAATLEDGTFVIASHHFGPPDRLGLSLLTYDGTSWQVSRHLGLMESRAAWASIAIDPNGDAWFVDHHDGGVLQLTHDGSTYYDLPEPSMMWIAVTPYGDLWVTDGAALYRYDGSGWVVHPPGGGLVAPSTRTTPSDSGEFTLGYGLGFGTGGDEEGQFWISEPDGVSVYREGDWERVEPADVPRLDFGFIGAVVQGPDGSTWVITKQSAVYRYSDGSWERLGVALAVGNPASIAIAHDGSAWFTADNRVGRITP